MEFFSVDLPNLTAAKTPEELWEKADKAYSEGKIRKAARTEVRAAKKMIKAGRL